jgi:SAM-dependent methyltransferase
MKKRRTADAARVDEMLGHDQPGLFAAIGELDWYSGSHRQWIDDQDLEAGDRVLEVGCATGALTSYLAGNGYRVTGLDRSTDMITRAGKDHPQLEFVVGDATSLSYDDNAFDAVVAASVINVVRDAKQVLSEMQRVCVPGGTVSVLVPASGFTDDDHDTLIETLGLAGFSEAALTKWHRGPPKMSRSQLETLFRSVDLEPAITRSYLDGMLIAATAPGRSD